MFSSQILSMQQMNKCFLFPFSTFSTVQMKIRGREEDEDEEEEGEQEEGEDDGDSANGDDS